MKKKFALTSALFLCLTACGGEKQPDQSQDNKEPEVFEGVDTAGLPALDLAKDVIDPADFGTDYLKESARIYNKNYGKFYDFYEKADEAENVSMRYAYQALAEAKLMETGTLLPGSANGGSYAISRIVPGTITPCYWGNDSYRYHNALILKGNPLTAEERAQVKTKYNEYVASGADDAQQQYEAWVKNFFQGREFNRTYNLFYTSDPETYDIHNSYYASDSEPLVNTFDGLIEYNGMNQIKPALAQSWTVSNDGTQYAFTIREGAKWVDKDGNDVADVKADDFVAGFQHMLDCAGGLEYLVQGIIKNATEYLDGDVDFDQVGVKAEGNVVTYTLEKPISYFMTMLSYSIFAPLSRSYYTSQGGKFGEEFDASAESYNYAKDYDHIAYCGPYLVKTYVKENTFEFEKNAKYWNVDNLALDKIVWLYNDGSDTLRAYNSMKDETVASAGLNTNALQKAKDDGMFDTYAYVSGIDANSYPFYINLNRQAYANFNDDTVAVSAKTDNEKQLAQKVLDNAYCRLGLTFSIDRKKYYTPSTGEELALKSAVNSYTPGNFVKTEAPITIKINGKDVSFGANTYYGAIMQAQIDADGFPMKVWDPTLENGAGSSAGYDGWYNKENAQKYFKKGLQELKEAGVVVNKNNPFVLDLVTCSASETTDKAIKAMQASIQDAFGDVVKVNIVDTEKLANFYYAEYYPNTGDQTNCDLMTVSGWGPDFGDPDTYLATFTPSTGGMLKCSGIF